MGKLSAGLRSTFLALMLISPFILLGWITFGPMGGVIGLICGTILFLILLISVERQILASLSGIEDAPSGLKVSLERAVGALSSRIRLLVCSESGANAVLFKKVGRPYTMVISKGLLVSLNEDELRTFFATILGGGFRKGIHLRSFCTSLALLLNQLVPGAWLSLLSQREKPTDFGRELSPAGVIRFSMIYPWMRLAIRTGGQVSVANPSREWLNIEAKLIALQQPVASSFNLALVSICLCRPWNSEMLLPFSERSS